MTNLFKRFFTHKSKFLLIIISLLGLAFSYSCSCRNETTKPPVTDDSGIFKVSEADGNIKNAIVKSATTDTPIKITLTANKDYSFDFEVEDSETDESKKITKDDFTATLSSLQSKDTLAEKVKKWETPDKPTTKNITVKFSVSADDTTLQNANQNIPVVIKLTHAKKLEDTDIKNLLNSLNRDKTYVVGDEPSGIPEKRLEFIFGSGTYSMNSYTIKNSTSKTPNDTIDSEVVADLKKNLEFYVPQLEGISKIEKVDETEAGKNFYNVSYNFIFADDYEYSGNNKITFEFKAATK